MRGKLDEVCAITSSGNPALDQSIVLTMKQSSFPFSPKGASVHNQTFIVRHTYY